MSLGEAVQNGPDDGAGTWSQEATGPSTEGEAPTVDAAFKLQVEEGSTVSATFPFFGDVEGGQLSFQIGDHITVLQKDELWSWGKLERTGQEGWFPHNYVQASFQPLPGMHELKQRILIKKAREEAIARGEDPDAAEALILNGGVPPTAPVEEQPALPPPQPEKTTLDGVGLGISAEGWDWGAMGTGLAPTPARMPEPQPQGNEVNNGVAWGTHPQGGDPDMFGMWMEDLGEDQGSEFDDAESVASATSSDRERRRRERKNIARELLDTEDKYVRMLEALLATIINPCLGHGNKSSPLSKEEAKELFGTLRAEEILAINTAFREQLRGRMASLSDETCFGDLFKRFAPFLKMYVEYCTQHENTASRVSLIAAKNDKFGNLLHRARSDPRCQDHDAQSLLIMPIQRIPRYKLLLEGMLKNTENDHPDRPLLQNAIEQISDVASFINDSIKRRENQAKIWDLQAVLSEPIDLATPTRIFIRSGVLTKLGRSYQDRDDFFALFNDGLLHAKPATFSNKYIFKRIDPVLQVENVGHLADKPKALHVFRVVTKGHIYLLSSKSAALKKDWMRVLELCIRGGKRETIHKGPLRVIRIGKEAGVRIEYFYVFNDVVVRGKALWRGKFKHKETMVVTRVDASYELDGRALTALPKEVTANMAHQQTFRIFHRNGSLIVMAKSETDKVEWVSALEHQMNIRKTPQIGTVAANNRIVHQDNFAHLDDSTRSSNNPTDEGASKSKPTSMLEGEQSHPLEKARRAAAAATFGVGPVENGLGQGVGDRGGSGSRSLSAPRNGGREPREGSPPAIKMTPLATTSELLISLQSSDEEDDNPPPRVRQSMPHLQRQQQQQQTQQQSLTDRRRTVEGHVSPPKKAQGAGADGRGWGGVSASASRAPTQANGSVAGPSLLDKDLMAVLGAPATVPQSFNYAHHHQQQQGAHGTSFTSFGNGGTLDGGVLSRGGVGPGSASSSVPLLRPPARDTPSYPRSTYGGNSGGASSQLQPHGAGPGAMVPFGGGSVGNMEGTQVFGDRAMVPHAGNGGPGFQPQGPYGGLQQPQAYGMQGHANMNTSQQQPSFGGNAQNLPQIHQQPFPTQVNGQFAPPQQQQHYQQPPPQQQFAPQQQPPPQQHPMYFQQPMPQQFQRFS